VTVVSWWKLNEGSGTTAGDSSGYGNDGTITGADWVTGYEGYGLEFHAGDRVVIPHSSSYSLKQVEEWTIKLWVKPLSFNDYDGILTKTDSVHSGSIIISFANGKLRVEIDEYGGGYLYLYGDETLETGKWYRILITRRNGTIYVYVNGVRQQDTSTALLTDAGYDLRFGQLYTNYATSWNLDGVLDDVVIEKDKSYTDHEAVEDYLGRSLLRDPKIQLVEMLKEGIYVYEDDGITSVPVLVSGAWADLDAFEKYPAQVTVGPEIDTSIEIMDLGAHNREFIGVYAVNIWVLDKRNAGYTPERLKWSLIQELERVLSIDNLFTPDHDELEYVLMTGWADRDEPENRILRSEAEVVVYYKKERST